MKKKLFVLLIIFSCIIVGCQSKEDDSYVSKTQETYDVSYNLQDGRKLIMSYNPPYEDDSSHSKTVGDALYTGVIEYNEFIKNMKTVYTMNDGGSTLYKYDGKEDTYGNLDFYIMDCRALDGNDNIYISRNEISYDLCKNKILNPKGIKMSVIKNTINEYGLALEIASNSDKEYIFGEDFFLEEYRNGNFKKMNTQNDLYFTQIAYKINKDDKKEFDISWQYGYGSLKKGKYRVVKTICEEGIATCGYIASEFEIK